jgi:hypothetical protein
MNRQQAISEIVSTVTDNYLEERWVGEPAEAVKRRKDDVG